MNQFLHAAEVPENQFLAIIKHAVIHITTPTAAAAGRRHKKRFNQGTPSPPHIYKDKNNIKQNRIIFTKNKNIFTNLYISKKRITFQSLNYH